jgi:hypothetical protein
MCNPVVLTEASVQGNFTELGKFRIFKIANLVLLLFIEFCEYFKYKILISVVIMGLKLVLTFSMEKIILYIPSCKVIFLFRFSRKQPRFNNVKWNEILLSKIELARFL